MLFSGQIFSATPVQCLPVRLCVLRKFDRNPKKAQSFSHLKSNGWDISLKLICHSAGVWKLNQRLRRHVLTSDVERNTLKACLHNSMFALPRNITATSVRFFLTSSCTLGGEMLQLLRRLVSFFSR